MKLSARTIRNIVSAWFDDGILTDYASEYGEPGYSTRESETPMVAIGDLWKIGDRWPRLMAALEEAGVDFVFYGEWTVIDDGAYRTCADCYQWQPSFAEVNGDLYPFTGDLDDFLAILDDGNFVNNPRRALNLARLTERHLIAAGFTRFPNDSEYYESGWHPGQDDDPATIYEAARAEWDEVVFVVDGVGQFDVRFTCWGRYAA